MTELTDEMKKIASRVERQIYETDDIVVARTLIEVAIVDAVNAERERLKNIETDFDISLLVSDYRYVGKLFAVIPVEELEPMP